VVAMLRLLDFVRDPAGALQRIARDGGDVAFFRFGRIDEVLVSHPDAVEEVLVTRQRLFSKGRALQETRRVLGEGLLTSEGDVHLTHRRLIQPLFHQRAIGAYAAEIVGAAGRAQRGWADGGRLDLHEELMRLTLAIVSRTVFDAEVEEQAREVGDALTTTLEVLSHRLALPFGASLYRLPLPATRRFDAACARLERTIDGMIAARRRRGAGGTDLLSLLLGAGEEERLSDREIRDEAMTILVAGHETTAVWLSWTMMALARRADLDAAVRAEIVRVAGDRPVGLEDLPALELTDRVLHESLRLYPPAWLVGRRALADVEIGGRVVPAGTIVVMSQWVVHRDARWYPEPERFDPDRWLPAAVEGRPRFAFFPFGAGTRRCIGEGFAWMEAKLLLAALLRDWRFELDGGRTVRPVPRITLRPGGGMPVTVRRVRHP
jgi:cytochrome P450